MVEDSPKKYHFYEIQKVRQIWVWIIILLVFFALVTPILIGEVNIYLGIILFSFGFGFIWLFWGMKLITEIKEDGIKIIFSPFTNFIIPFNKIKKYQIRQYRPIIEYGGWGIRGKLKKIRSGKAYTISGTTGLQIRLFNEKDILIGTQNPDALLQSLDKKMK
jgi:hypothetical protein